MPVDETLSLRDDFRERFESDGVGMLLAGRNANLGNILLAERGIFYLQILYRILLFRREHEIEPLHEDIYEGVRRAQEAALESGGYSLDSFRQDTTQLVEWKLLDERMEMERLRGYRDSRRKKFRYSLTADSQAFLEWLEDRAQADLEPGEEDTRDVLEEVCGILAELHRKLHNFGTARSQPDDARRVLYQLFRLNDLTHQANSNLGGFNARLLSFSIRAFDPGEARDILRDLDDFVNRFLRRVYKLRHEITEGIEKLLITRFQDKLRICAETMESERRKTPRLLRESRNYQSQIHIPFALSQYYEDGGRLDQICHRIRDSAMKVWRKLHAHLRELERKNNRVQDIRERIAEIAKLPAEAAADRFLLELISSAAITADPNYWDDYVLAAPPQPRMGKQGARVRQAQPIREKLRGDKPAVSIDEQRLRDLADWTARTIGPVDGAGRPVGKGDYRNVQDAERIIELAKAGLLGNGRRLGRVDLALIPQPDEEVTVELAEARLRFNEMLLKRNAAKNFMRLEP